MNKRVAIIIERADAALGGAERSVFELANALSARGLEADILAAKGNAGTQKIHILCQNRSGKRVSFLALAEALGKHLSANNYDIVHSVLPFEFADIYQPRGGTYAEAALRNAASYQNRLLKSYKELTAFANLRRSILLRAERKLSLGPDGPLIAALSQYVAEQFKRHYGTDTQRIVIVPNGVKTDRPVDAKQAERLRSQILSQLGIAEADKPVLFLFVANNFRLKGLAALIEAMSAATRRDMQRKAYLIVAGSNRMQKYRRLANRLGLHTADKRIIFLDHLSHIQNALSIIDVAVLPTYYDPSSRFILESLAAGKPVITTRFNGAIDLFVDNRHGKVIDAPENISALTEAICYFTDTDNIQKASQAIITDDIKDKISIGRVAEQLITVYESVLQKKGQRSCT